MNLEKRNSERKSIKVLKNDEGEEVTDPGEILQVQSNYYKGLYSSNRIARMDTTFVEDLLVPNIDDYSKNSCEGALTEEECFISLRSMAHGKVPGSDGFPAEFYLCFWDDIKM